MCECEENVARMSLAIDSNRGTPAMTGWPASDQPLGANLQDSDSMPPMGGDGSEPRALPRPIATAAIQALHRSGSDEPALQARSTEGLNKRVL